MRKSPFFRLFRFSVRFVKHVGYGEPFYTHPPQQFKAPLLVQLAAQMRQKIDQAAQAGFRE